jgi:hypothetical protein
MPDAPLDNAIAAFNRGAYFDAAEMFERIAAEAAEDDLKALVGALNRIAAALHMRFERGTRRGTINLLSQAMLALDDLKPARAGLDIERLYAEVHALTEEIRASPRDESAGVRRRARIFLERRRAPRIRPAG